MKYVFFGTPEFASMVLKGLLQAGMPPMALVANPDRPVGRKKILTAPLTKQLVLAEAPSTQVFQPEKIDDSFFKTLKALTADFFLVAAYAKILPDTLLSIPRLGTIGVHPSLLPKYRGASPIQSVILHGESETGVSLYLMDAKMDHGPVLVSEKIPLDSLTTPAPVLEEKLARLSASLLVSFLPKFTAGQAAPKEQDHAEATFTRKFSTEDAFIKEADLIAAEQGDQSKARDILRKMNAFTREPGTWTIRAGKRTKLLRAKLEHEKLILQEVQTEGEKPRTLTA